MKLNLRNYNTVDNIINVKAINNNNNILIGGSKIPGLMGLVEKRYHKERNGRTLDCCARTGTIRTKSIKNSMCCHPCAGYVEKEKRLDTVGQPSNGSYARRSASHARISGT